jgi:hypothetical protein
MQKVVSSMPKKVRTVPMAADVVRDTNGKFRVMELNSGGQSGFLSGSSATTMIPPSRARQASKAYYRHVTGRAPVSEAAITGVRNAAITGGAALGVQKAIDKHRAKKGGEPA